MVSGQKGTPRGCLVQRYYLSKQIDETQHPKEVFGSERKISNSQMKWLCSSSSEANLINSPLTSDDSLKPRQIITPSRDVSPYPEGFWSPIAIWHLAKNANVALEPNCSMIRWTVSG